MFGEDPSYPARVAARLFTTQNKFKILELGGGQGRDSLFFARNGFDVTVLDYSDVGLREIQNKAVALSVAEAISTTCHDIRKPLPFEAASFDAVYAHMLYCMALTSEEIAFLSEEVLRVLKPGGISIYTVRHIGDPHYGTGVHLGEDIYETGGFMVHFFSAEKVHLLADRYELLSIEEFEEGGLPRKLFLVTQRKPEQEQKLPDDELD